MDPAKAAGCLIGCRPWEPLYGLSGWANGTHRADGTKWTSDILNIVQKLGLDFAFAETGYDGGKPGQHYASHIEARMLGQVIKRHCSLAKDGWNQTALPPVQLVRAKILTTSRPCSQCERLIRHLNGLSQQIEIQIKYDLPQLMEWGDPLSVWEGEQ